uniref:Uncharacterized protein n=1 Tax=Knipowitschia caucasica TaxID=637954 RepID=A0AAV2M8Z2_KNICA
MMSSKITGNMEKSRKTIIRCSDRHHRPPSQKERGGRNTGWSRGKKLEHRLEQREEAGTQAGAEGRSWNTGWSRGKKLEHRLEQRKEAGTPAGTEGRSWNTGWSRGKKLEHRLEQREEAGTQAGAEGRSWNPGWNRGKKLEHTLEQKEEAGTDVPAAALFLMMQFRCHSLKEKALVPAWRRYLRVTPPPVSSSVTARASLEQRPASTRHIAHTLMTS